MSITYKGPDGRLYRVSERPDAEGLYYIEYRDPAASAVYKPLPGYDRSTNRAEVVEWLDELAKDRGLGAVTVEDKPTAKPAADIAAPGFDFSALGDLAEQAAEDDQEFDFHAARVREEYGFACVYLARVHDLTARAGRYGGGTWTKWCEAKGLSEGTAKRMLEIGDGFKSANLADLKNLAVFGKGELRAIATSGSEEVKEAATAGDTERVKGLLAQLKATEQAKAEVERKVKGLQASYNTAHANEEYSIGLRKKAEEAAEDLKQKLYRRNEELAEKEQMLNVTMDQQGMYIAKMQEQEDMLADLQDRLDDANAQLRNPQLEATVVDKDEVERRARELAEQDGAKWEELCQNQQATIMRLQKGSDIIARVSAVNDTVKAILDQLYAAINDAPYTTELCAAVLTLGDALGDYYADFSAFCGEEGCEDE